MLRVYTREFVRDMMAGSAQVEERPVYVEVPGRPRSASDQLGVRPWLLT